MTQLDLANLSFEQALAALQALVAELERGDNNLEQQLAQYEQGMALIGHCSDLLDKAELRVQELSPSGDEIPFAGSMDSRS